MNIDTQDLSSYIAGYDDYVDDTKPVYSTKEYYDMKELLESEIEDKEEEIERLQEDIGNYVNIVLHNRKEIERLKSIIKEVREKIENTTINCDGVADDLIDDIYEILEKVNK